MLRRPSSTGVLTDKPLSDAHSLRPLSMVGTIHLDRTAIKGLYNLLSLLEPELICVEISRFSVKYRQRHQELWLARLREILEKVPCGKRQHFRITLLERQLRMPFEWETALMYGKTSKVPVIAIDSSAISKEELPRWGKDLLNLENLLLATSEPDMPVDDYFSRHYGRALTLLSMEDALSDSFIGLVFNGRWCKREKTMTKRLIDICSARRKVTYIGGWMHLLQHRDILSLASLNKDIVKDRFLITGDKVKKL